MGTVTITKREYEELKKAREALEGMGKLRISVNRRKTSSFFDGAFGILKGTLGRGSSSSYVARLRKSWRA